MTGQRGFTLIELMVVMAVIALLAYVGTTQYSKHIRSMDAAEAQAYSAMIERGLKAWVDGHVGMSVDDIETAINSNHPNVSGGCSNKCLTDLIPETAVDDGHDWAYVIDVELDTASRDPFVCIKATKDGYPVYYSTVASRNVGWDEHFYKVGYVNRDSSFQAGGSCRTASPTADATSNG